ncbi:hypothetical protein HMPREF0970_01789 [Schaalia odontolytica F0309]|uniref:Polyprenyl diphosphate synthase n=3 Tax=Schaalia TaxID=2529408 RepID=A0A857A658_9ACTO|nr:hypothetical protein ACTODO_01553 [Schaalia odontolytica ATCC 17982]EFF79242.1 hypothetical protein HMPREF0970_01789 [Schaalia odontolytica F0309]QGS10812.1 polyprenyl diphosphate synthase [Schaalia odontolytica]
MFLLQPMHSHKLQLPSGIAEQGARRVARTAPASLVTGRFRVETMARESRRPAAHSEV